MRRRLLKLLGLTEFPLHMAQKWLQRYLGPNGDLKVLALLTALVVFSLIRTNIGHSEKYRASVHATLDKKGYAILSQAPNEVEIELKGSADDIKSFNPAGLEVKLRIVSTPNKNEKYVKISRSDVVGHGKLRVVKINPPGIVVKSEPESERIMMVKEPELLGKPLQGEASVKLASNTVTVTGPESQLKALIDKSVLLPTEPIDVTGKTQGFNKRVKVMPPDDSGISLVVPTDIDARVDITIVPPVESIYTNLPPLIVTNQTPLAVTATTNGLTNTVTESAEYVPNSDAASSNSEVKSEFDAESE